MPEKPKRQGRPPQPANGDRIRMSVFLTASTHEAIRVEAARRGRDVSLSQVVEEILRKKLAA
jgi:ribonuclease PH